MKSENELSVTFPSLSSNEGIARAVAGIFVSQQNPTIDELADIKCAVSEAVTNSIVHGYKNSFGDIQMTIKLLPERTFKIEIKDKGIGIPDIAAAMEPLFTTDAENERSGLGFSIMESFMDTVSVRSSPGKGCRVVMVKKLSPIRRTPIHN
ncbi:MAG: anti-sigma F factor [Ruminococcaceae bacterium]|nr:anti-sigma F factor [Oscillospiraceae bacterium]